MWKQRSKRKTKLIVPSVSRSEGTWSLNNNSWFFDAPYCFRDALDIKYEERKKDKKPYMVWTQGPRIAFKEGDLIQSRCGHKAVQVRFASPMGWDVAKDEMFEGSVVYTEFMVDGHKFTKQSERSCTQMQFLQLLISGDIK
jgi:hypothetical protein